MRVPTGSQQLPGSLRRGNAAVEDGSPSEQSVGVALVWKLELSEIDGLELGAAAVESDQ